MPLTVSAEDRFAVSVWRLRRDAGNFENQLTVKSGRPTISSSSDTPCYNRVYFRVQPSA
jgi:hypothetical protein